MTPSVTTPGDTHASDATQGCPVLLWQLHFEKNEQKLHWLQFCTRYVLHAWLDNQGCYL